MNNPRFSVCMSVYKNDKPADFLTAVRSIYNQTVTPNEVVLVVDGPVGDELKEAIATLQGEIPVLKVIPLKDNMGHAIARQTGLEAASNNLVAVMDADDVSVPTRFERQLQAFAEHPEVSVVGGIINEFIENPTNVVGTRICPENDNEIKEYLKSRCPFNQMTVMFRKSEVMSVGGYMDWFCNEDYYLWIRMAEAKLTFHNLQEILVYMRVGRDMYARRGGWKYFKSEAKLQQYMYNHSIISMPRYIYNVLVRLVVQVLMPNSIRAFVFQKLLRK